MDVLSAFGRVEFMNGTYLRRLLFLGLLLFAVSGLFASCDKKKGGAKVDMQFAQAMLEEHNYARTKPREYAEKFIKPHVGKANGYAKSCYETMTTMKPVGALKLDDRFCKAAQWFANDLGRTGKITHTGSDGSQFWGRLERQGAHNALSESCSWGVKSARGILVQLLIDKGTPSLGHRENALDPRAKVIGVGQTEGVKEYGVATVIDYGY